MTAIATVLKRFRVWRATRKINRALNIELYDWQKDFIFYNEPIPTVSNDGIIRQCYGYKNNRAKNPKPDEIKAFEAQYQNYLTMTDR